MITANIHDAKTHLSEYLELLAEEGEILLCKRNKPIARILPIPQAPTTPRPLGGAGLGVDLDQGFWDPLDEDLEAAFNGL